MIEYVAGFLFSQERDYVALIHKQKPNWQKGKLNAIGGKIEAGETPHQAMVREFAEEASVEIDEWQSFAVLRGADFIVHFFCAFDDKVFHVKSAEDEHVDIFETRFASNIPVLIPNLKVLLPLALDQSGITKPVTLFDGITEASQQRGTIA